MKPVPYHSAECGEWYRPPGEPARSRGRPQRYTRLRNRECPRVSGGVTWKAHPGAKQARYKSFGDIVSMLSSIYGLGLMTVQVVLVAGS